jgi:squalene-hopene/tetraprenyl-beta-curcumene cyclase
LIDLERLERAYRTARDALLAERTPDGHWVGELSTSALSTATAVSALALVQKHTAQNHSTLITGGIAWLAAHQNTDGGWGDTTKSLSNISTTMLCRAAFHITGMAAQYGDCLSRCGIYLAERFGHAPEELAEAVRKRYGKDRTFSVPILMTCALAGLVEWREVPPLPFELACFPQSWFRFLRLPVVSYALPALIAIGQAIYHHRPPRNPITRLTRRFALARSLRVLQSIQPSSGGFLEATPLTSFVTMSLASIGHAEHPVASKAVEFLVKSVRPDGSWAIDSNLATWVTTLAVNALATARELDELEQRYELSTWLQQQQCREHHPYTGAAPGGWGWTYLPGSVPDGDDTPGALLALLHLDDSTLRVLGPNETTAPRVVPFKPEFKARCYWGEDGPIQGLEWMLGIQNSDGGWPTFCRGWGTLPFDRSGVDLTAHTIRALHLWRSQVQHVWRPCVEGESLDRTDGKIVPLWGAAADHGWKYVKRLPVFDEAIDRGVAYLARAQRPDGSWLPLWFGNQHAPNDENPTYGTARVLAAYRDLGMMESEPARRGVAWLLDAQNADGGWGGAKNVPSSVEETALAVEVLVDFALGARSASKGEDQHLLALRAREAVNSGLEYLVQKIESGGLYDPAPIGFYFAKLWYFEKLYPIIFSVAALGRALRRLSPRQDTGRLTPAARQEQAHQETAS